MSQNQQQVSLVVVQPFAILEAVMTIPANGGSDPQKLKIREDAEFVVTHVDVDLYSQYRCCTLSGAHNLHRLLRTLPLRITTIEQVYR